MEKEDWEKALAAWTNVKNQAQIDAEQADLYLEAIKLKLESFK